MTPDSTLAALAGLALGDRGAVVVDKFQRTCDPAIYAVGDMAAKPDAVGGGRAARKQGAGAVRGRPARARHRAPESP